MNLETSIAQTHNRHVPYTRNYWGHVSTIDNVNWPSYWVEGALNSEGLVTYKPCETTYLKFHPRIFPGSTCNPITFTEYLCVTFNLYSPNLARNTIRKGNIPAG